MFTVEPLNPGDFFFSAWLSTWNVEKQINLLQFPLQFCFVTTKTFKDNLEL